MKHTSYSLYNILKNLPDLVLKYTIQETDT